MDFKQAIMARLAQRGLVPGSQGAAPVGNFNDPRSQTGTFSRGSNVYNGGSASARSGPSLPSQRIGRPTNRSGMQGAIARRLGY